MSPCIAALGVYLPTPKKKRHALLCTASICEYDSSPQIADSYVVIGNTRALYSLVKHEYAYRRKPYLYKLLNPKLYLQIWRQPDSYM